MTGFSSGELTRRTPESRPKFVAISGHRIALDWMALVERDVSLDIYWDRIRPGSHGDRDETTA
jgi:hypothetical protein